MYKIIGGDQKEYGPVTAEQLHQWITEGRVNAQTPVQSAGATEWKTLSGFPEFADALAAQAQPAASPGIAAATPGLPTDILSRDYELDIGACIGNGWNLLMSNLGLLLGGVLIYAAIEIGIAIFGAIPLIGPLFSIANLFVVGPLMAGLYYITLRAIRRQPAGAGDVFTGFKTCYWQLFLGQLVPGLLVGLCLIPVIIVGFITILPAVIQQRPPGMREVVVVSGVALLCLVPIIFLRVNWAFALPLIIDKRVGFWPAMQLSWRMVRKHWWHVFALVLVVGLINAAGMLLCCVGLLFSLPLGIGAMMHAYETIFSSPGTQTS